MSEDSWLIAESQEDDQPVIYRLRKNVPSGIEASEYSTLLNIYWAYEGPRGMPCEDTRERQSLFESAIERIDAEAIGFLMLVITGAFRKEWIYYIQDPETFITSFNESLAHHAPYPVELEVKADPGWATWRSFLANMSRTN